MELERYRVEVNGIVQGVGFRPFVYKLADSLALKGAVRNTTDGVLIEVEGPSGSLEVFLDKLVKDAPPLAVIDSVSKTRLEYYGYEDFTISSSSSGENANTLISPDISTCPDCRKELFDSADHRHLYPFINCTNCGPRFTIVCGVPYDRANTTMKDFDMCPVCGAQYRNPTDRRYHAQPLCCRDCGPGLLLTDASGRPVASSIPDGRSGRIGDGPTGGRISVENSGGGGAQFSGDLLQNYCGPLQRHGDPLQMAAELLDEGRILAVKSLGGYHLVCNALDGNAVGELRRRKHRDEKPFALMARDLETVRKYCVLDECSARLLQSTASPIVLLPRKEGINLPEQLAPGNPNLGVMLPYTPLQLLLFFKDGGQTTRCPEMLVMTSGNRSDEPICFEDADAFERLGGIADYFLTNNRPIRTRTDDSVVRAFRGHVYFIRRSRGYAPAPITIDGAVLPSEPPSVLALGGELKNTFCLTKGNRFFVSHHIGDMENLETLQAFEDGIEHYKRLFDINPTVAAFDMHPAYLSTEYARSLKDVVKVPVQHHHAHVASCMAENNLAGDVIGVAFDGTGYGEDGNIWGGEIFTGGYGRFERAARLQYFRLPGSEAAVREPWRVAAACLYQSGFDVKGLKGVSEEKLEFISGMLEKGFNSPLTSSMGRLFDAVAALAGIRLVNRFEGQAAVELEHAASGRIGGAYCYRVENEGNIFVISIKDIIDGVMGDLAAGSTPGMISGRFHGTVACMVEDICRRIRREKGLDRVVLSGGVFQNMLLLSACMEKLENQGFKVFIHRKVPANDGGISLGQAAIAMARCRNI